MKISDKQNLKHSVVITYNKERRLHLIEGLKKFLDNSKDVKSYYESSNTRLIKIPNLKNVFVQFEDKQGNKIDTDFTYSIEKFEDVNVLLPVPSSDKEQCQKLLDELVAKQDTHRLNVVLQVIGDNENTDPNMDDDF